jgi:hypothetical protein
LRLRWLLLCGVLSLLLLLLLLHDLLLALQFLKQLFWRLHCGLVGILSCLALIGLLGRALIPILTVVLILSRLVLIFFCGVWCRIIVRVYYYLPLYLSLRLRLWERAGRERLTIDGRLNSHHSILTACSSRFAY